MMIMLYSSIQFLRIIQNNNPEAHVSREERKRESSHHSSRAGVLIIAVFPLGVLPFARVPGLDADVSEIAA